jgi:hypothetical protein
VDDPLTISDKQEARIKLHQRDSQGANAKAVWLRTLLNAAAGA